MEKKEKLVKKISWRRRFKLFLGDSFVVLFHFTAIAPKLSGVHNDHRKHQLFWAHFKKWDPQLCCLKTINHHHHCGDVRINEIFKK